MDYTDARKLAAESGAPEGSPLYNAISRAATDLNVTEHRIRGLSVSIRSELEGVALQLDRATRRKPRLNGLGELQSRGPAIDVAVAIYSAQQKALDTLLGLAQEDMYPAE